MGQAGIGAFGKRGVYSASFTASVTLFGPGPLFLTRSRYIPSDFGVNFTSLRTGARVFADLVLVLIVDEQMHVGLLVRPKAS